MDSHAGQREAECARWIRCGKPPLSSVWNHMAANSGINNVASCGIVLRLAFLSSEVWKQVGDMPNCWVCVVTVSLNKMQNRSCFFHCPMLLYIQTGLQKLQEEDAFPCGNGSLPALWRGSTPGSNCTGGADCPAPPGQCDRVPVSDTQSLS